MTLIALYLVIALAFILWITAGSRVHRAREEGFVCGFLAAVEAMKSQGGGVDPEHRAAQLDVARRGLQ